MFDGLEFVVANSIQFDRKPTIEELIQYCIKVGHIIHTSIIGKMALTHPTLEVRLQYCGLGKDSHSV